MANVMTKKARAILLSMVLPAILLSGASYQGVTEALGRSLYTAPGRLIDLQGRKIHVTCTGDGKPTVVFEASGLSSSTEWEALLPQVARTSRACAYDRAGMGWSDPVSAERTPRDFVDDLHAALAGAGERPPYVLVGHSAGGVLVRAFQAAHPDEVCGLVLVDTATATMLGRWSQVVPRMLRSLGRARWLARLGLLRLANPLHIDGRSAALTYRARTMTAAQQLVSALPDALRSLPVTTSLPTVVLTHARGGDWAGPGTIDPEDEVAVEADWQAAQLELAAGPRARLVVAARSGHMIPAEQPELVVSAVGYPATAMVPGGAARRVPCARCLFVRRAARRFRPISSYF